MDEKSPEPPYDPELEDLEAAELARRRADWALTMNERLSQLQALSLQLQSIKFVARR